MILSQSPPHFCFPLCVQAGISISLMDNFFLGSEIRFGNSTYRVINRIGCWGPDFQYPVYESECFVNNIRVPNRALKTLSRTVAGGQPIWEEEGIWENVNKDITEMLDCFIDPGIDTTLLLFDERFYINSNNVQYICIAFALQENMSLRTAMLLDQRFSQGFTVPQIRRAASNMVSAIRDLHHFSLNHTELSAGHLVCSPQHIKVAATCSAFEVDWHAGFAANHFLPINRISDWGRAPILLTMRRLSYLMNWRRHWRLSHLVDCWRPQLQKEISKLNLTSGTSIMPTGMMYGV